MTTVEKTDTAASPDRTGRYLAVYATLTGTLAALVTYSLYTAITDGAPVDTATLLLNAASGVGAALVAVGPANRWIPRAARSAVAAGVVALTVMIAAPDTFTSDPGWLARNLALLVTATVLVAHEAHRRR